MTIAKELSHHSSIQTTMTYYAAIGIDTERRLVASEARKKLTAYLLQ